MFEDSLGGFEDVFAVLWVECSVVSVDFVREFHECGCGVVVLVLLEALCVVSDVGECGLDSFGEWCPKGDVAVVLVFVCGDEGF